MPPPLRIQGNALQKILRNILQGTLTQNFDLQLLQEVRPVIDIGVLAALPVFVESYTAGAVVAEFGGIRIIGANDRTTYPLFVGIDFGSNANFRVGVIAPAPTTVSILNSGGATRGKQIDNLSLRSQAIPQSGTQTAANWADNELRRIRYSSADSSSGPGVGSVLSFAGWALRPGEHFIVRQVTSNVAVNYWIQWAEGPLEA